MAGAAERLPPPAGTFDLMVSTTSFDHWADQRAGLVQCARVRRGGSLENSDHHLLAVWAAGCAMHALDFFEEARQTTTVRVRPSN